MPSGGRQGGRPPDSPSLAQARLAALADQWQFLVQKSAEKSQKLKEANKQQNFNTGIKDFDFWLSEVTPPAARLPPAPALASSPRPEKAGLPPRPWRPSPWQWGVCSEGFVGRGRGR